MLCLGFPVQLRSYMQKCNKSSLFFITIPSGIKLMNLGIKQLTKMKEGNESIGEWDELFNFTLGMVRSNLPRIFSFLGWIFIRIAQKTKKIRIR